jgi:hypothetical protein
MNQAQHMITVMDISFFIIIIIFIILYHYYYDSTALCWALVA